MPNITTNHAITYTNKYNVTTVNLKCNKFTSQAKEPYKCKCFESGLSILSENTRKSNRLQMSLQGQSCILSYLKTLSAGPAGV